MLFKGKGIKYFRLVTMKHAIKLEKTGVYPTPGSSWTKTARAEFQLPHATHDQLIAHLEPLIETLGIEASAEGGFER